MIPFEAPVEDIVFSLAVATEGAAPPGFDLEEAGDIIRHFAAFAEAEIAPLDASGDREGCRLEGGRVRMPAGFRAVYRRFAEDGWPGLTLPATHGGAGRSALVGAGVSEIFTGANHAFQMVTTLVPGAARTLAAYGTEAQRARYLPRLASGALLSTMCLTEPGAGSDLSRIATRARRTGTGWMIEGEKIFISGGDQDLSEGILHLVLARTGAPDDGVKGLSLFLCPAEIDGGRNAVAVARIEDKLGIHAAPTCHLRFEGARAERLGEEGGGLAAMFTMMNHARLDVALQGIAHAARAGAIARAYAAGRSQGRREGGAVTIDRHPAVAAMLHEQEALALGGRLMCHEALVALETGKTALADFMTPVCKVFCTEAGIRAADLGIQVLGGYGYLREYRVEQTLRDARIAAIYEGTNEIHALTLATRLLRVANGAAADAFEAHVADQVAPADLAAWRGFRARVASTADPARLAVPFMRLTGRVAFRAAFARLAARAGGERHARLAETVAAMGAGDLAA